MNNKYNLKVKKGTLKRVFKMIINIHGWKLLLVLFLMIIGTGANITSLLVIQKVLAEALDMLEVGSTNFSGVVKYLSLMGGLYLISILFNYGYLKMMISIGQNTLFEIRHTLFTHMMKLPLDYFDSNQTGDLMSRFTNDVDAMRQMISQSLPQLIMSILTIVGYFTAMLITSPILTAITTTFSFLLLLLTISIARRSKTYFQNQQFALGRANGFIEEMIEGQKVIKVYRHEKTAINDFHELNEDLFENSKTAAMRAGMLIPITVNLGYFGFAIAALSGAFLVTGGYLLLPALVGYLVLSRNITGPINQISQQVNFIQLALAGASRVFETLDEEIEEDLGKVELRYAKYDNGNLCESEKYTGTWGWKVPDQEYLIELKGDVRFNNVNFGYIKDKLVLKDVSLFAKPGQKIAFVGSTGAGKTTITNLINRFYDIDSGEITYDGINIKDIQKSSLRRSLGMVLQDTHLFEGSIYDNIRYGNLYATDEEIIEASKIANAHDFIMKMPEGYNTILKDDAMNLSQGQRQLLSIARAAINNPPVLILDEATSSIDTYTEQLIQKGMDKLMTGRTVFVIAHRLSTIKNSKAIILLENGEIVERGNHDNLIDLKGRYFQLYTGAFELE